MRIIAATIEILIVYLAGLGFSYLFGVDVEGYTLINFTLVYGAVHAVAIYNKITGY